MIHEIPDIPSSYCTRLSARVSQPMTQRDRNKRTFTDLMCQNSSTQKLKEQESVQESAAQ